MIGSVNNPGFTQMAAPATSGSAGSGHSRFEVDARALGKPLPAAQPINSRFANGADRHFDGQNLYGGMTKVGNPFVSSDDHLLATDLKNNLPLLDAFKKEGRLTQSSLQEIAKEEPSSSKVSERTIMLAREILNRPRLNDAITAKGGEITHESLTSASDSQIGNTNPNTQSADPFHGKTNAQVVQAFKGKFNDWRDKSQDNDILFGLEKHRYVRRETIIEISKDPNVTDAKGEVVRDPRTGFPLKKYSEDEVYLAKNLVGRPGLLDSLDSYKANGYNIFGSRNDDGWLKNYSIDRWLENDKKERG
ncbi:MULTISPECIES: hypothetical protein [Pseudomonas]|uniref:Uncharacterized protein n=1 Tax=Pseudomonas tritici TaxID=2745518 RepID=A0A8H9YVK8_9PSED|nr:MULTISPECIES: hypothetical protein [Pseudomonas]MBP2874173.1 hypothetical protein [Pseudomonas sp. SWRI144]MBW8130712.1 hypothetical protein [Pseudomonas sp. LAP_36]MBW8139926.1 hypothetical protein [Pseudomonas sp. PAMC 26818]QXH85918.1 hypothetical protein HU722_0010720 [Pseudomonas tritici]CRM00086.1 hypothetical protein [Pseudomonas sp. 24 E 1]